MQLRKTLAVGALGVMTAMSTVAFAATLDTYPAPFATGGNVNSLIVIGANAASSDVVGAVNLGARLAGESFTPGTGSTVTVEGAAQDDINIDEAVGTDLGTIFDDSDIAALTDASITFNGNDVDYHDEIRLGSASPSIETSLTSSDDDYTNKVYMETAVNSIQYFYIFDEEIDLLKVSTSKPLEIDIMGKHLKITKIDSNTSFTAQVGEEVTLSPAESTTSGGKTLTLTAVSDTAALVNVDGTSESISEGTTETVNGLEVNVDDVFNDDGSANDFAILIVGGDVTKTYKNDKEFIGEPTSNYHWKWILNDLNTTAAGGTGTTADGLITIGVQNEFTAADLPAAGGTSIAPVTVGGSFALPFDFASLDFVDLTVADEDFATVTVRFSDAINLGNLGTGWGTSEDGFVIESSKPKSLVIDDDAAGFGGTGSATNGISSDVKSDRIYLTRNTTTGGNIVAISYEDTNGDKKFAGTINMSEQSNLTTGDVVTHRKPFGFVDFKQTSGSNNSDADIVLQLEGNLTATAGIPTDDLNLTFNVTGKATSGAEGLMAVLGGNGTNGAAGIFARLGQTTGTEELTELRWSNNGTFGAGEVTAIGTKDEDHRTEYGTIIRDPKGNSGSDKVVLEVPGDVLEATIRLGGASTTTTATGSSGVVKPISSALAKLDTEVTTADEDAKNLILVGGPCVNSLVNSLATSGKLAREGVDLTCNNWPGANFGIIRVVDGFFGEGRSALVVAGTRAQETTLGTQILQNFGNYKTELTGMEAEFTGADLSSVEFV